MIRLNWLWVFTSFLHFACGFDLSHVPTPAGESQGTAESRSDAGKKIQFKPAAARITISQGNPVSFNCSIAVPGYQQDLRIKWLKNDKHLIDGDRCSFKGISFSDSEGTSTIMSSCRIENVVHSDAGAYYCWIQITDEPIESEKIILEIEGLPSFIREPESKNVSRNASFNLTCEAVGPPYPVNIHWLQDGITIKTIENTTLSVLNVAGVHKRTRYSCEAHNEKGVTVSRKAQVNVKEAPDPPVDLRIRNQTAHVVVISWEPGFDGYSSLNICQIQVEKDTRDEDNVMTYLTAVPPYKYRILDLQALTSYNISVSCKNEVGWSNCSPGIQAKTTEGDVTLPSTSTVPAVGDSKTDHSLMVLIGIVCISGIIVIVAFVYAAVKKRAKEMRFGNVFGDGEDMEPTVSYTVKKTYLRRTVELTLDNLGIREELKEKLQDVMIDRSLLTLGKVLGEGEFGSVVEGHIKQADGSSQKVAVKTMKLDDFSLREIEEFLSEAACMKDFDHPNVIKLLGVCLELGSREQIAKPMVILPFMKYGDLHSFLLRSRLETNAEYIPLQTLLKFMIDIASGMEYLSNRSFLHRDLAARNCMLQTDMTVCVADFGLSKKIYSGDYYRQGRIAKMPVKWIALESLADRVFTVKSDVWAFGITMWEIVTRGMTPYPGIQNHEIYEYLQANNRLKQPSDCLDEVYDIMYSCWRLDPADRPTFSDLKSILSKVLDGLPKIQGKEDIIYVNTGIPAEQRQLTEDAFSDIDLSDPTEAASCSLGCAEATVTVEVHRTLDLEDRYVASDVPEHQGNTADIETPLLHGVCLSNGVKLPPPKPNSGDIPFADDSSGDSVVIL
ncbi:tyrosine-protein kinase Mer isoform X2 [Pristis pectinata]|uniref:tyrosine-protein kinase Mer isoform X2 n=1 Tax=Pristis pectinata TaxID=685728 RepID=UPI00223E6B55|nr:tyrosine-protein kinase Mer isoform X2 [Pristis pectinata]